jgi:hypothetical protein
LPLQRAKDKQSATAVRLSIFSPGMALAAVIVTEQRQTVGEIQF